jgi:hypothetical protein
MEISGLLNVDMIRNEGIRVVRGKIPREVRKELSLGVKLKWIGHLKKDGLKPEMYFHPDKKQEAIEEQKNIALNAIACIKKVLGY